MAAHEVEVQGAACLWCLTAREVALPITQLWKNKSGW
jgi:hypothetical protein